jgi:hypothetical protein
VDASLSDPGVLVKYVGKYVIAGRFISVELIDRDLYLIAPGQPRIMLIPAKQHTFRTKEYPDYSFVFVIEHGEVTGFKQIDPSGEYKVEKQK